MAPIRVTVSHMSCHYCFDWWSDWLVRRYSRLGSDTYFLIRRTNPVNFRSAVRYRHRRLWLEPGSSPGTLQLRLLLSVHPKSLSFPRMLVLCPRTRLSLIEADPLSVGRLISISVVPYVMADSCRLEQKDIYSYCIIKRLFSPWGR